MISPWTSASLASRNIGLLPGTATSQQLLPRNTRPLGLDLRAQGLGSFGPSLQIGSNFLAVAKIVGDDRVDVGQLQGVVGANHVFRRHAVLVLLDDEIE